MMRSTTLSPGGNAPPGGHVLPLQCSCCSACSRRCTQTFRDIQVSIAEPLAESLWCRGSLVDWRMQSFNAVDFLSFFFFCLNHVLHINRRLAVLSLWQSCEAPPKWTPALPPLSYTNTGKHTPTHSFFLGVRDLSLLMSTLLSSSHFLSRSHLDVVKWVITASLRGATSHAEPSIQRVLGGPVQRVVLWERQHHCISLWTETVQRYPDSMETFLFHELKRTQIHLIFILLNDIEKKYEPKCSSQEVKSSRKQ